MAGKVEKVKEPLNLKKEAKLSPGYIIAIIWVVFTFAIVGWVVCASFLSSNEIFSQSVIPAFFGKMFDGFSLEFRNYVKAWKTQKVSVFFMNSLFYTVISCTLIIFIAAPASYALSRFKFRFNKLIQNMIATALGIPVILIIMPLFSIVSQLKLTNTRFIIIFLYVAMNVPFSIFFLFPFYKNLSFDFEEAASIDGCTPFQTFWRIIFPLIQPGIITVTVFNFITIWNEYFMSMIFVSKSTVRPIAVGLYNMVQSMRYTGDWGGMFASVVIVFLPTFVLYIFLSDKIIEGVTSGAIKG